MPDSVSHDTPLATPFNSPSRERDEAPAQKAPAGPAPLGLKVLIADDSPVVAKVLSSVLRRAGYEVVTAADGIEAAQAVYRELPDVVLLDIFMPRMNGYPVNCRLLPKQDEAVSHIPVLINTASEGRSAEFWSLHTGADGFMLKGISPDELSGAIARVTSGKAGAAPALAAGGKRPAPKKFSPKCARWWITNCMRRPSKAWNWKPCWLT